MARSRWRGVSVSVYVCVAYRVIDSKDREIDIKVVDGRGIQANDRWHGERHTNVRETSLPKRKHAQDALRQEPSGR